jgi:hypothetical protein
MSEFSLNEPQIIADTVLSAVFRLTAVSRETYDEPGFLPS